MSRSYNISFDAAYIYDISCMDSLFYNSPLKIYPILLMIKL